MDPLGVLGVGVPDVGVPVEPEPELPLEPEEEHDDPFPVSLAPSFLAELVSVLGLVSELDLVSEPLLSESPPDFFGELE